MSEPARDVVVAIHQPNFFPWLGYFDKIAKADVFVVLDDVQFEKSGSGTWSNRVKLLVAGRPAWVTMPVRRDFQGVRTVNEMQIDIRQPWREKMLKTIKANYARARHVAAVLPLVETLLANPTESVAEFNIATVTAIRDALQLPERRFVRSSSLGVEARSTDRLVDLVKAVGGTVYLAGGGAAGYQADNAFAAAGVQLRFQNFVHPVYPQRPGTEFAPGLSSLDALLCCGARGTAELLLPKSVA